MSSKMSKDDDLSKRVMELLSLLKSSSIDSTTLKVFTSHQQYENESPLSLYIYWAKKSYFTLEIYSWWPSMKMGWYHRFPQSVVLIKEKETGKNLPFTLFFHLLFFWMKNYQNFIVRAYFAFFHCVYAWSLEAEASTHRSWAVSEWEN